MFVRPNASCAMDFETDLNGFDTSFFGVKDVPICLAWREKDIQFEALRRGLERTLNRIPIAAGRVIRGKTKLQISNKGSAGCLLEFETFAQPMPNDGSVYEAWAKFGVAGPPIPSHYLEPFGRPLISAKLVEFSDGCALYINFSHTLFDAESCMRFMQVWSWEAANLTFPKNRQIFPAENPGAFDCNHILPSNRMRHFLPQISNRLSVWETLQFIVAFPITEAIDEVLDLEFPIQQATTLKSSILKQLQPGQWISSFEGLVATVLKCISQSETSSKLLYGHVVTNMRGKSQLFTSDYFGVAVSTNEFAIETDQTVPSMTLALHDHLRRGIKEISAMEAIVLTGDHFKAAETGRFGMFKRLRNMRVWKKLFFEKDRYLFNSWAGYDWLNASFGCGAKADLMRVDSKFSARRQVLIFPRSANFLQLRIQLPPNKMTVFKKHLGSIAGLAFKAC